MKTILRYSSNWLMAIQCYSSLETAFRIPYSAIRIEGNCFFDLATFLTHVKEKCLPWLHRSRRNQERSNISSLGDVGRCGQTLRVVSHGCLCEAVCLILVPPTHEPLPELRILYSNNALQLFLANFTCVWSLLMMRDLTNTWFIFWQRHKRQFGQW